jgi:hypothetical protein
MANVGRSVLAVVAVGLLLSALYLHLLAREVKSWPTTVGTLDSKGIVGYGAGSDGAAVGTNDYAVYVSYSYQVGDKVLRGSNIRVWDMTFSYRALAEDYLKDNHAGAAVRVFYNPAKPDQSYLSSAYPVTPVCLLLLGAAISGAVAVFCRKISKFFHEWSISKES